MPLNSIAFLVSFGVFALVFYGLPQAARQPLLLAASLAFYATFNPWYLAPLLAVTAMAYVGARTIGKAQSIGRRHSTAAVVVVAILAVLVVVKYLAFALASFASVSGGTPAAPSFVARLELLGAAGLSFYTFSAVSYVVDVHRGILRPEHRLVPVALYLAYFPKLLAGPIERASAFLARLDTPGRFDDALAVSGLQQMLWGLFKKVVIADRLAVFVDRVYAQPSFASPADLVLATYAFAFQIYCDFSGYSDIAIGASRILGMDLNENFRRPYLATSVSEFWSRRWHLSLSGWFRDYLYIPLGGSRVSAIRQVVNILAVFLLSGAWHGANWTFVCWGGLNGLYVAAGLAWRRWRGAGAGSADRETHGPLRILQRLATFHLVLVTWVFFRAATVEDAVTALARVSTALLSLPQLIYTRLAVADLWLSVALISLLLIIEAFDERRPIWSRLSERPLALRWATYYALGLALLVLGVWTRRQFVYMQF